MNQASRKSFPRGSVLGGTRDSHGSRITGYGPRVAGHVFFLWTPAAARAISPHQFERAAAAAAPE